MSDVLERIHGLPGHNIGTPPPVPLPSIAEQLDPEILADQYALDYAKWEAKRDELRAGFIRLMLRYSSLPRHAHDALPATGAAYELCIAEFPDRTSARQFNKDSWQPLDANQVMKWLPSSVVIPDEAVAAQVITFVRQIKDVTKLVESDRKKEKTVFDAAGKVVQGFFQAGILDVLEPMAKVIEAGPLKAYQDRKTAEETRQREAEAKRLQDEADAAFAIAARTQHADLMETAVLAGELADRAVARAALPAADMGRTKGSKGGVAAIITTWKYRVTDESKLPDAYWIIDHATLAADVKRDKDKAKIAGVEIYSDTSSSVR
jgi:hypothetical protein